MFLDQCAQPHKKYVVNFLCPNLANKNFSRKCLSWKIQLKLALKKTKSEAQSSFKMHQSTIAEWKPALKKLNRWKAKPASLKTLNTELKKVMFHSDIYLIMKTVLMISLVNVFIISKALDFAFCLTLPDWHSE